MSVKTVTCSVLVLAFATAAAAQTPATPPTGTAAKAQPMASIPSSSMTVTEWYKQNVYDPQDNKIGEIMDVLMDHEGKATALMIGVGGFLGAGEKDVAVPFNAVQLKTKNSKPYLVMNATKDELKNAKGFKYDRNALNWIPDESTGTVGRGATPKNNP
jgi:sporulation protein YlmC with PRC-barrel domain